MLGTAQGWMKKSGSLSVSWTKISTSLWRSGATTLASPTIDDDIRYVYEFLEPHPRHSFNQMSYHGYKHRASCIECPAIRYFYYVITNSLQARGEVSKVNEENMLVLGKAANLDVGYSPNLGAILLFHLAHQSNCAQGDIVCGGVITMLANSLGLDYTNLRPIVGNTLVNISVLTSAAMVVVRRRRHCIRIPGVEYLLPTPMPNRFSIEERILHYVPQEGDAAFDQEAPEPEQVDEEELATDEEEDVQPQEQAPAEEAYTTYSDIYSL